jgi:hypothetical protein
MPQPLRASGIVNVDVQVDRLLHLKHRQDKPRFRRGNTRQTVERNRK